MLMFTQFDIFKGICLLTLHKIRGWSLFIGRRGGAGANRGWATIVCAWLKVGAIKKYANVLPAKMLKAASGCHQQIQPIKIALYNTFY